MDLIAFLGWLLVFNISFLLLSMALVYFFSHCMWKITVVFVDLKKEDYLIECARFMSMYKLLIVFFLLIPYLVLKLELVTI